MSDLKKRNTKVYQIFFSSKILTKFLKESGTLKERPFLSENSIVQKMSKIPLTTNKFVKFMSSKSLLNSLRKLEPWKGTGPYR